MMNETTINTNINTKSRQWPFIMLVILGTVVITVVVTVFIVKYYFFPSPFKPVVLNAKEEQVLTRKLKQLNPDLDLNSSQKSQETLEPEPYNESNATRTVLFNEREVNALMAKNTNLADRLAIDFSDDLISAKLLVPMDPDFPVLGGQTVRINVGMQLAYKQSQPIAVLKGVSVMGVPLPNAWLGNLKHVDLIKEFGEQDGFWKAFAAGIEQLEVEQGRLKIQLKE